MTELEEKKAAATIKQRDEIQKQMEGLKDSNVATYGMIHILVYTPGGR